jgi:hypothetical protein
VAAGTGISTATSRVVAVGRSSVGVTTGASGMVPEDGDSGAVSGALLGDLLPLAMVLGSKDAASLKQRTRDAIPETQVQPRRDFRWRHQWRGIAHNVRVRD